MEEIKITIVGAGVIGLAVGFELAKTHPDIAILERNPSFGQETSSRNSEVIHAGIYYPQNSLKARTCVEGKNLLYEFCQRFNIAHKKIGKLVVAVNQREINDLEGLLRNGEKNGVSDLILLNKKDLKKIEPGINALAAIHSPSTGILDTHNFMKTLSSKFISSGGQIAYNTELTAVKHGAGKFNLMVNDRREGNFKFSTQILINSAGLHSDKVAQLTGINKEDYKIKFSKGDYFRVSAAKSGAVKQLIYPAPKSKAAGLGIHATPDLAGGLRLGPDDQYVKTLDYNVDASKRQAFFESVRTFLPFITAQDLAPDMAGIRPKLQGPGEPFRDFLIKDESAAGIPGLINLIGIESPGLTASLAIAMEVKNLVAKYL